MISVRRNVFETNSSSTHSLTMCSEDEYNKWKNGELLYKRWDEKFYTKEQIIEKAREKQVKYLQEKEEGKTIYHYQEKYINASTDEELYKAEYDEEEYQNYDDFWDYIESEYETFENSYTTEKGEKVITFGFYGYNG